MAPKPSRRTNPQSGRRPKQSTFQGRTNQIGLHADQPRHPRGLAAGPHRTPTTNSGRLEVHWSPACWTRRLNPVAARVGSAAGAAPRQRVLPRPRLHLWPGAWSWPACLSSSTPTETKVGEGNPSGAQRRTTGGHSCVTQFRNQEDTGGLERTRRAQRLSTGGHARTRRDTEGHAVVPVRDRERLTTRWPDATADRMRHVSQRSLGNN